MSAIYIILNHRFSKCNCNLRRILPRVPQLCCISLLQRTCIKAQGLYYCFDLKVLPEFWRGKGKRENIAFSAHGLIPPFCPFLTPVHLIWGNPRQSWILDCTMWIRDSSYWIPVLFSGTWFNSGFQSLVGFQIPWDVFWIPKHRILDSASKNFPDSRIWIPLHGVNLPWRVERDISEIVFQWWIQGSPPLIFFTKLRPEGLKKFFLETAPPPPPPTYLRVWMTIPRPPLCVILS